MDWWKAGWWWGALVAILVLGWPWAAPAAPADDPAASPATVGGAVSPDPMTTAGPGVTDPPAAGTASPTRVEVGLYVIDLAKLDMKESEFFADFYIWFKVASAPGFPWTPDTLEFMNGAVESMSPLASEPLDDGRVYWTRRVKGRFRGQFRLQRYPFDAQELPLVFEDSEHPSSEVVFERDATTSADILTWIDPKLEVPDWRITAAALDTGVHHYVTGFGLATATDDSESKYARLTFRVRLTRLFVPHLIKFVIPLLVIAGMAYMVFWIHFAEFETQCAICVTALLSAVALHNSQADSLPAVGYMVMADKVFILFYIVIFSALVQTVWANNLAKAEQVDAAQRLDDVFRWFFPLALVVGSVFIWVS
ncbi:MAG: hypothetical protein GX442_26515 [Candidatus Riflebacteria bacterium]|nr:hypothetical protein [Candidatus Riflebacteria bacterium]